MDIITELILCLVPAGTASAVIVATASLLIKKIKRIIFDNNRETRETKELCLKILAENAILKKSLIEVHRENVELKKTLKHIKIEEDKYNHEKKWLYKKSHFKT